MQPAYAALLTAAVNSAEALLKSAFSKAMFSMRSDVQPEGEATAQQTLALALQCIDRFADQLCAAYPMVLRDAHHQHTKSGFQQVGVSLTDLNIEQLELMDPTQVQERIERVRALQHILLVAGDNLAALDAHFAALEGIEQVNPARNPLRPDVYLSVLQSVMTRFKVPRVVRVLWLQHLSGPLATGLNAAYAQWRKEFHIAGVSSAKQSIAGAGGAPLATSASANRPQGKAQVRETLLTLERLSHNPKVQSRPLRASSPESSSPHAKRKRILQTVNFRPRFQRPMKRSRSSSRLRKWCSALNSGPTRWVRCSIPKKSCLSVTACFKRRRASGKG